MVPPSRRWFMRILICSMHFWPEPTGIGKYSGEMAFWLASRGHDVRVICSPPWYPHWKVQGDYRSGRFQTEVVAGVTICRCPIWVPQHVSGLTRILCLGSYAISSAVMTIGAIRWRPDVIFSVEPPYFCLPAALAAAKFSGARTWLHIQDFEVDAALQLGLFRIPGTAAFLRWSESFLIRCFHRTSTISGRMLDLLKSRSAKADECVLFPNWVDLKAIFPLDQPSDFRVALGLGQDQKVALYAGNMGEKQGLEIILDAARVLSVRSDVVIVLCGHGAAADRIRSQGKELANIRWLPVQPVELLNCLLNLADIHLLPQRADAADLVMPSKLTGILASGRPVVATAGAGTQVHDVASRCGFTVEPGDVGGFVSAVEKLVDNPDLRRRLGEQGRAIACSELNAESILAQFEVDLNSLCRKS